MKSARVIAVVVIVAAVVSTITAITPESLANSRNFTGIARVYSGGPTAVQWEGLFGHQDAAQKLPLTADTKFRIGSNSKLLTAIAIYQLQEKGLLHVSDSIANYLNASDFAAMGFPNVTVYCPKLASAPNATACQVISFEHLLSMSSGIPESLELEMTVYPGSTARAVSSAIMMPLLFIPGMAYYYSNPSFNLAAYLVERISGVLYEDYVEANIIIPGGLRSTSLDVFNYQFHYDPMLGQEFHEFIDAGNRSHVLGRGLCTFEFDAGTAGGAGGFISTVADEAKLYYQLFNTSSGGAPYFKNPASLQALTYPRTLAFPIGNNTNVYYGQAIYVNVDRMTGKTTTLWYEGGFECTLTANIMDVTRSPPVLVQAWTNKALQYVAKSDFEAVLKSKRGVFVEIVSGPGWKGSDAVPLAQELLALFYPQQQEQYGDDWNQIAARSSEIKLRSWRNKANPRRRQQ